MRPIVFILFFMIFASASLVWVLNDPDMQSFRDGPIISTIAGLTAQENRADVTTAPKKMPKRVNPLVALEKKLATLTARLLQVENRPIKSSDDSRLEKLEALINAQQAEINTQRTEINAQRAELVVLTQVEKLHIDSGFVLAKKSDKSWKMANMFSKKRNLERRVSFTSSFTAPPKVVLGITSIELLNEKTRFKARAVSIDSTGFTMQLETKSDSRIGEVSIDWAAFGG
jgi:preprotein translocase subunit Sec63